MDNNLLNKKFGRLTVIGFSDTDSRKIICKCDCGNIIEVLKNNVIRNNHTTSCGCALKDKLRIQNTIHGGTKTKLYYVYHAMKNRCYREKDKNYKNYGGKGIEVCDKWLQNNGIGFKEFKKWSYDNGYYEAERGKCTLDRIDINKNYSPENCRWVSNDIQAINKSNNRYILFNNEKHTVSEVARAVGINPGTIIARLNNYGYSESEAIVPPKGKLMNAIYFTDSNGYIIKGAL